MKDDWLDDILHDFSVAESLSETHLNDKLKRRVISADEYDDRLVEDYRNNKEKAKQEILDHIDQIVREVVGQEEELPMDDRAWDRVQHNNQLRQEQLKRWESMK